MKIFFFLFSFLFISCESENISKAFNFSKGDVLVANGADNSLSILKDQNGSIPFYLDSKNTGFVHNPAISKGSNLLLVAQSAYDFSKGHIINHSSKYASFVNLYNLQTGLLINEIPVENINHDVIFEEKNKRIWTQVLANPAKIKAFDINGKLVSEFLTLSDLSEIILVNNEKYVVYASEESSFLSFINTETLKQEFEVKIDKNPSSIKSYNDEFIVVSNENFKSINIVNVASKKVVDFLDLNFKPGIALMSSENQIFICDYENNNVQVFEKKNSKWTLKTKLITGKDPHNLLLDKSQNKLFVSNQLDNSVSIFDINSFNLIKTHSVGSKPNGLVLYE